jgi:modulator of FtsH protease
VLHEWENFAVIVGSAAGALTGLLFVAVSLNRDRIVGHPGLRAEAGQTLVLFIVALLVAVLLVIPGMSAQVFGVVLILVSIGSGLILSLIARQQPKRSRDEPRGRPRTADSERRPKFSDLSAEDQLYRLLDVVSPNLFSMGCILIAGCLELADRNGLYWLAAAVLLALGGGVVNAWLFLTRPTASDTTAAKDAATAKDAG